LIRAFLSVTPGEGINPVTKFTAAFVIENF